MAFAAVDEGLLALRGNDSWDLLHAMLRQRAWGVATATGQSEIVGRRHYGRKAVAGRRRRRGGTRELFDTLLLWKERVVLDARGEAVVEVPLNDSLTTFRLVAIADDGAQPGGSGATSIRVTQDLQVLSGLPPLVREGDRFVAMLTQQHHGADHDLRASLGTVNSGTGEILRTPLNLPPRENSRSPPAHRAGSLLAGGRTGRGLQHQLGGGGGREGRCREGPAQDDAAGECRRAAARAAGDAGAARRQLGARCRWRRRPMRCRARGQDRGGLTVALQPRAHRRAAGPAPLLRDLSFICLEQKVSKSRGPARRGALWAEVSNALPTYLDSDGLANYFPPRAGTAPAATASPPT